MKKFSEIGFSLQTKVVTLAMFVWTILHIPWFDRSAHSTALLLRIFVWFADAKSSGCCGGCLFAISNSWPNKRSLLGLIRFHKVFSEPIRTTWSRTFTLLTWSLYLVLAMLRKNRKPSRDKQLQNATKLSLLRQNTRRLWASLIYQADPKCVSAQRTSVEVIRQVWLHLLSCYQP